LIIFEHKFKTVMSENQPTTDPIEETTKLLSDLQPETPEEKNARLYKERVEADKQAKKQQKEMDDFYREALPLLRRRAEYHRLMAEIPEDILRRVKAEHEHAQILAQQREWEAEARKKMAETAAAAGQPEAGAETKE
jgi:hypothetical protein